MKQVNQRRKWVKHLFAVSVVIVLVLALVPSPAGAGSWGYYKNVTFQGSQITVELTNFPVLISLTDVQLKHTTSGGHMGKIDATDIRFTDSANSVLYDHEIENYVPTTGELQVWVRMPTLPDADTTIRMWYGNSGAVDGQNASGVWNANYKGVWHLKEAGNGTVGEFADSTSNANSGQGGAGTASKAPAQSASGKIGYAQDFDGADDYIQAPTSASLEITGSITLSAWVNYAGGGDQIMIAKPYSTAGHGSPYYDYSLHLLSSTAPRFWLNAGGSTATVTSSAISGSTWAYVVGTYDGTTMRIYRNGTQDNSTEKSGAIANNGQPLRLGTNGGLSEFFNNLMDEVRISNTARSAEWIQTEYNNQSSPSSFHTVDAEDTDVGAGEDPVPEFSTFLLVGMGMVGLGVWFCLGRRRPVAENAE